MENGINWREYSEKVGENILRSWQTRKKKHPNRPTRSTAPKSSHHNYGNDEFCIPKEIKKRGKSWDRCKTQRKVTRQFHPDLRNMQKGSRYFDYDFEMQTRRDTPIILEDLPSIFSRRVPTSYKRERGLSRIKPTLHCIDMSLEKCEDFK